MTTRHKTVHMSLSVRGALDWPRSRLEGFLRERETGKVLSAWEVRDVLLAELEKGHEVIPIGKCPGFDFRNGCPGHEEPNVLELTPEPSVPARPKVEGRVAK